MMRIKNFCKMLVSERVPGIVCTLACVVSVLMGFGLGYFTFASAGYYVVYADTAEVYHADSPNLLTPHYNLRELLDCGYGDNFAAEYEKSPLYIVTVHDGFLVVFHAEKYGGGIKEITSIYVGALTLEEQDRLTIGIRVYSEEELVRTLQDYGS